MPRQPHDRPWVVIFILLSLLAHLLFVLAIVIVTHFLPTPKLKDATALSSVTLSLEQAPPTPHAPPAPPPKRIFMPTTPDAQAKPQNSPIESDNDTRLRSQSPTARLPDSLMPDLVAKRKHAANLHEAPNAPSTQPPHPAQTAANAQNQQQQKTAQTAQQTQAQPSQAKQPAQTATKQPETSRQKTVAPKTSQQAYDPNGLPVLPALAAPTMAPTTQRQQATPASSIPEVAQDVHGALGAHGEESPAAMATEFGRYKAKVYRAVGARWYRAVDKQFQLLGVGRVHIQFTIHDDGSVDTKVLEGDEPDLQILLTVSRGSIVEAAPFEPFTDSLRKEIAREENNDGSSYTDDFWFTIYGGD